MTIALQIADIAIAVTAPAGVIDGLAPYVNAARHDVAPQRQLRFAALPRNGGTLLPSGRFEISPGIAAEALWGEIDAGVQELLRGWLQLRGLCLDGASGRCLVIGEDEGPLRLLAVEAMAAGINVASAAGVCLAGEAVLPHALPLHVMQRELRRIDPADRRFPGAWSFHDEMGERRRVFAPPAFGLPWTIRNLPLGEILVLDWNAGGRTGIGPRETRWAFERLLAAAHVDPSLDMARKMALLAQVRRLAAALPMRRLCGGRLDLLAPLLARHMAGLSQPVG